MSTLVKIRIALKINNLIYIDLLIKYKERNWIFIIQLKFTIYLKSKITDSEAYRKYLLHKDISEHNLRWKEADASLPIDKILWEQDDLAYEKNKAVIAETLFKYKDLLTADLKLELEETKRKFEEDVAEILFRIKLSEK